MPSSRLVLRAAGACLVAAALTGCADTRDQSLCDQAADLQASVDQLRDLDPATATADEIRDGVETVILETQQLRAAADGTLQTAAADLQAALDDLRRSLSELDEGDLATARPLIEDTWSDVTTAYANLEQRLQTGCDLG